METIDEKEFNEAEELPNKHAEFVDAIKSDSDFNKLVETMKTPLKAQRVLAAQMKRFLDRKIDKELREKGSLSDHTRRWVEVYNKTLESIQRSTYGDKSVNLNMHVISHSQIAAKIRKVSKKVIIDAV